MPIGSQEYAPIPTMALVSPFAIAGVAILVSSLRDGMFCREFAAIRTNVRMLALAEG
jgi:hypothetical protein